MKILGASSAGLKLQSAVLDHEIGYSKTRFSNLDFIAQSRSQLAFQFGVDPKPVFFHAEVFCRCL